MIQSGGRLLGQGVYGCVFEPAPRCAGGHVFKHVHGLPAVGKVTIEDSRMKDEIEIGRKIMELPLAKQYFALPTESCAPAMPIEDPDVSRCDVLDEMEKGDKLGMLILPAAGTELMRWARNLPRLAAEYERIFIHLLEGMIIYQKAGYVHNDIHMGNILVDAMNVARYIDFGETFTIQTIKAWDDAKLGTRFRPKYLWQAPEVHAWRMIENGVSLSDGVSQLKEIHEEYRKLEQQFPVRKSLEKALKELITTSKAIALRDGGAFVRAYGTRFDSWRIGLCFFILWQDLLEWSEFSQSALWKRRDVIRRVLNGLTEFNPRDRMLAADALRILDPQNRNAVEAAAATAKP
jgi:hypothetical protein